MKVSEGNTSSSCLLLEKIAYLPYYTRQVVEAEICISSLYVYHKIEEFYLFHDVGVTGNGGYQIEAWFNGIALWPHGNSCSLNGVQWQITNVISWL